MGRRHRFTIPRRLKYLADPMLDIDDETVDDLSNVFVYPYKWRQLPQDIVFDIFLRLSAQVIYEKRRVYKEWKLMTGTKDFIYNHLQNSTPGIIILECFKNYGVYVEMRRGCLEICKFNCKPFYVVGKSVNGLVLGTPSNTLSADQQILSVFNPLTKQQVGVPYDGSTIPEATLAFAEASMKYKVVFSCLPKSSWCVRVLTIGADKDWRYIDIEHISMLGQRALRIEPFVTRGYVHWIDTCIVLTLNVETETIYEFAKPQFPHYGFLAIGRNLSSYHYSRRPESREYLMKVMEMNPETGEWSVLFSSDLKPLSERFEGLNLIHVFGILDDGGEVFLFGISGSEKRFAAYNIRTREIQWFKLKRSPSEYYVKSHVNSMVWLESS